VLTQINAALQSDSASEGGFLVPSVLDDRIAELLRNQGVQRRNATVIPNAPRDWGKLVKTGYSTVKKVSETTVPQQSQGPSWSMIRPPSGTYEAQPAASQQLLSDATFDLERDILADIATGMSELENVDFIRGTGVNEPLGWAAPTFQGVSRITNETDKVRAYGKVQYVATGDANGFTASAGAVSPSDCLTTMLYSLKVGYRSNARFVMNSLTAGIARNWKDANGRPLWIDSVAADTPPTLLGRPVDLDEDMDDVAAGKFPIALGDWSRAYVVTDIRDTLTLRDPFTAKPYVLFFVRKSVGGMPMDTNSYKLLKVSAS
jgi:HK97 family phage major capsid protein